MECKHQFFKSNVCVNRLFGADEDQEETPGTFSADIHIRCVECGQPFQFLGLERGSHFDYPRVSAFGQELRAPIAPAGENDPDESEA